MKKSMGLLCVLMSFGVSAGMLEPQSNVELLFVDGEQNQEKRQSVSVDEGPTQLVVKYSKKLSDSGKSRVFDSAPYVIMFNAPERDLMIEAPKLHSYQQANAHFKQAPEWVIKTKNGESIEYSQEVLDSGEGIFPYYDLPKLVAQHNQARGVLFGASAALVASAELAPETESKQGSEAMPSVDTNNLEQLKAWYLKSSTEERKAFRRWMIDQE